MTTFTFLTAIFCLVVGAAVLWANPRRFSNQAFFGLSVVVATWAFVVFKAMTVAAAMRRGEEADPLPWLRTNVAISSFIPAAIALLKESLMTTGQSKRNALRLSLPWFGVAVLLALLCFTGEFFVRRAGSVRGAAYFIHGFILSAGFVILTLQGWVQMRSLAGIRRIEFQYLTITCAITGALIALLNVVGHWLHIVALNRVSIAALFAGYCFVAWAISYHRIFDVRQVFLSLAQRLTLVALLGLGILGLWRVTIIFLPAPADLIVSLLVCCSAAFWLDRKSREWLRLDGEEELRELRGALVAVARTEPQPEQLVAKFENLLRERCQTSFAAFLFDRDAAHAAGDIALAHDRPGYAVLCEAGWATPENLQRRRPSPGVDDLREFLARHSLGLVVIAPRSTPNPALLLALGVKTTRWPFTYPEVQRLQNIAELVDNVLAHARLTAQAALEAKMQHLALMSRGLAHDLKNLITPVSSFLVHTDGRFAPDSPEAEVHSAAKRSVRLMTDYVREALFFANRLNPHFEEIDLERVFTAVRDASAARAAERGVNLALAPGGPRRLTADAVLLQRMLGNLLNNAIDASSPGETVTLRCIEPEPGRVRFAVVDNGCGIPPENLGRVFEPYFTTKQFGDKVRGFGLGLTICEKIVNLHQGAILVRSEAGRGTSVTVDLPAAPSAFAPPAPSPPAAGAVPA